MRVKAGGRRGAHVKVISHPLAYNSLLEID